MPQILDSLQWPMLPNAPSHQIRSCRATLSDIWQAPSAPLPCLSQSIECSGQVRWEYGSCGNFQRTSSAILDINCGMIPLRPTKYTLSAICGMLPRKEYCPWHAMCIDSSFRGIRIYWPRERSVVNLVCSCLGAGPGRCL